MAFLTFSMFNFGDGVVASFVFFVVSLIKYRGVTVVVDVMTEGWVINNAPENGDLVP